MHLTSVILAFLLELNLILQFLRRKTQINEKTWNLCPTFTRKYVLSGEIFTTGIPDICHSRHCRRQCKSFASGVNYSRKNIFSRESGTQISCSMPKLLISNAFMLLYRAWTMLQITHFCGVKFLAWKSGSVNFLTNIMSDVKQFFT